MLPYRINYKQCRIGESKLPCQKPSRFIQKFCYNTNLWQTDTYRQTVGHSITLIRIRQYLAKLQAKIQQHRSQLTVADCKVFLHQPCKSGWPLSRHCEILRHPPPTLVDLLPMLCNQFRAHILNRATDTVQTSLEMFTMTSAEKSSKRGRRPTTAY